MSDSLWPTNSSTLGSPALHLSPSVCLNSCPLSRWCYVTILSSAAPFPFAVILSQNQGLFQWVSSLYQVAKVLGHYGCSSSVQCEAYIFHPSLLSSCHPHAPSWLQDAAVFPRATDIHSIESNAKRKEEKSFLPILSLFYFWKWSFPRVPMYISRASSGYKEAAEDSICGWL